MISAGASLATMPIGALLLGRIGLKGQAAQVPSWAWLGKVAGSVFLLAQPVAAPRTAPGPSSG